MFRRVFLNAFILLSFALPAEAATIAGLISDATGAALHGARVVVREIATGRELTAETKADGRYQVEVAAAGSYLIIVSRSGFAESARTIVVADPSQKIDVPVQLALGVITTEVNVTASRSEREARQIPLHVESMAGEVLIRTNPLSTGDLMSGVANITQVGGGPFGVRPRLRGLDSTRLLVLVDGVRLNTARQATDRTGAEVGLISPDDINRMEIVNGAGTLMYGSDALAGTINIVTNEPTFSPVRHFLYGMNGFYSSNEKGLRGTLTLGVTAQKYAVRIQGGGERFRNYKAGSFGAEDVNPLFASGQLNRADTIDDNFGFSFNAFPDPFNAPYVRTNREIPNSQARGNFVSASALVSAGSRSTVRARYLRRRMNDVGFPDFSDPYFFNFTSLPFSNLDRASVKFETQSPTTWLANLSVTGFYQRTDRLLLNLLPVQFPAPTAGSFFPINVMRLDIRSETEQRVWTPGVDVLATFAPKANHLLTAGLTLYRDRSSDRRTTSTQMSMVGQVAMGSRGPTAVVFPSLVPLGPPSIAHPVRVPDASLMDAGLFVQDEWRLSPDWSVVGGLRGDFYRTVTEATTGYSIASVVSGAVPAIDPVTLPDPAGVEYSRRSLTGELGIIAKPGGRISPFLRVGRSYRHPNLEEMLFAGPATVGSIAPNITVKPEVGTNFDAGAKFRTGRVSGGAYVFVNEYRDFISQEFVATTPSGPLAQAINFADVRIHGLELSATAPILLRGGVITFDGSGAFTRGTIGKGLNIQAGTDLAGTPADNIPPVKLLGSVRFTESGGRWWAEYGARNQTKVTRVASTLLDSPFLIAQDLLSLDGFTVHRLAWGFDMSRGRHRVGVTLAAENLTNKFYREQFQFAPARGRSFTLGFTIGGR
jgi:outer membrane receptor protein involved in Fe transport